MKNHSSAPLTRADKKNKGALRENVEAILIAIVLALFIRTFVVQAFKIPSGSMKNTLLIGDHILVSKFIYGIKVPFTDGYTLIPLKDPKRGDIVVFKYPEDPDKDFIKRVVGVGGDTVEIKNKKLYVNDQLQDHHAFAIYKDPHVIPPKFSTRDNLPKITVPENSLFVMGDNRDNSHDSRFWGFVDLKAVKGKAFIIYWSWNSDEFGVRWNRLGHFLK
ncbi:signal peptidase I Serine peptidase. MEROPS family S26A [Desulfocicer vacuolatum DSM 3385]|uniref:Signal peptidase I n=1 Tax=Desulfocicer vacuolatum DSM 3385 TaxID=1121400 RepID=A0A1W2CEB2_9BACT|nr:signal peptidase I [Desulfocicer vacuolatum]SMC83543.1 signal peptidase I Serine peptidase. MEROPS family S26A [Desulfocicer vacuolatum DSM 3385]